MKGETMSGVSKLITDEVVQAAQGLLKDLGKNARIATRLQAVIACKKHGISQVADVFGISRVSLTAWIKHVKNHKPEKLAVGAGRGRKKSLTQQQLETVKYWISQNSQITIDQLQLRIKDELGLALGRSTVHRIIQHLNFAYITPRPKHHKQDPALQEAFKKKSVTENS